MQRRIVETEVKLEKMSVELMAAIKDRDIALCDRYPPIAAFCECCVCCRDLAYNERDMSTNDKMALLRQYECVSLSSSYRLEQSQFSLRLADR